MTKDPETSRWSLSTSDFTSLTELLGADVLVGFARCFLHADRITSLITVARMSESQNGTDSVAFERDLSTVVWFVAGTLREMANAIQSLRGALAKRGLLDPDTSVWRELRAVESRWQNEEMFRDMRNKVAFHIDKELVRKGLASMEAMDQVVIVEGDSDLTTDVSLKLGIESLYQGFDIELEQFKDFLETIGDDQMVAVTIQQAFVDLVQSVGLEVVDEIDDV